MYCVSFVDVDGVTGEFRAGASHRQAMDLVDKIFCPKGRKPSKRIEEAASQFDLKPIVWYKLVKRPGRFKKVGVVVPETAREEPTREEPIRLIRRKKLTEDSTLLVANA